MPEIHSTGRGGAGNIGEDPNVYTDGSIIREGIDAGEHSTGRGGVGNIGNEANPAPTGKPVSDDVVPEPAFRSDGQENFHTGRGGAGNEHRDKFGGHSTKHEQEHEGESIKDKIKHALHMDGKK